MSSVNAATNPYGVIVCANAKNKTLSFIASSNKNMNDYKQYLCSGTYTENRTKIYAAKVLNPGDWKIEFLVHRK